MALASAPLGTLTEPVLPAQGHGTDGVLGRVVVGRVLAAVYAAYGPAPLVASVGHGGTRSVNGQDEVFVLARYSLRTEPD